jgi:hypothetical protein
MPANFNETSSPNLLIIRSLIHGAFFLISCSSASVRLRNLSKLAVYWKRRIQGIRNKDGLKKQEEGTVGLTKISRSFIYSGALGLKRQGQIVDGMVT